MPTPTQRFTFSKHERLTKKKEIEALFSSGKSFSQFPFRVVYKIKKEEEKEYSTKPGSPSLLERELGGRGVRIAVSVPKKKIKLAVNRNRIKRLVREAWRLNKNLLIEQCKKSETSIDLLLIYTGTLNPEFTLIQSKIVLILQRLKPEIQKGHAPPHDNVADVL